MAMSAAQLQKQARINRGEACLKYMQGRVTPVTLKELADKLKMTPRSIKNSLDPLLDEGKITRKRIQRQSAISKKIGAAYAYSAVDLKPKPEKIDRITFKFHDPFNMGLRA